MFLKGTFLLLNEWHQSCLLPFQCKRIVQIKWKTKHTSPLEQFLTLIIKSYKQRGNRPLPLTYTWPLNFLSWNRHLKKWRVKVFLLPIPGTISYFIVENLPNPMTSTQVGCLTVLYEALLINLMSLRNFPKVMWFFYVLRIDSNHYFVPI